MSGDGPGLSTKVARGVAWAAGAQVIIAIADIVSVFLVTSLWLSTEQFGVIGPLLPFYTALDYIADSGIGSALIQHDDHTPERVSTAFWFNVLVSIGLFLSLFGIGPMLAWIAKMPSVASWLVIAYGGKLLIQNFYSIPFALLRKELRFREIAAARVIAHLAESIGRVVFAAMGCGYWSFTLATLTRATVFAIAIQARHPFVPKLVFRPKEVASYLRFGMRTASSNVLYQVYTSMDALIVSRFFGASAAGMYSLADQFVLEPVKTIANVVIDVAYPTFAKLRNTKEAVAAQLIQFTRLNLIAVLPYTVVILLVIPEILTLGWLGHGRNGVLWTADKVELCGQATRILCVMGLFRSLGYLGPPVLDGMGRPHLTLRYMVIASLAVPASFLLGAQLLGPSIGFLSVAVAWALGYPLAFAALGYLVVKTIDLRLRDYVRDTWGIVATCAIGCGVGFAIDLGLSGASPLVRLLAIGGGALTVILVLLSTWQKITRKSILAALR